jgi:2-hydroxychromene-2-carboxylate isomerase
MSALEIDVFWSFRSPWSYLATPRLRSWQEDYQLTVNFRPVYPIAIRTPEFFLQMNPMWPGYFQRDLARVAQFLELPLTWPNPDPVSQYRGDDGRPRTSDEQPHIHRLTRLGIVAEEQGNGIEFADEISRLIWQGTENWHEGDHLAQATQRAGLDLARMDGVCRPAFTKMNRSSARIDWTC